MTTPKKYTAINVEAEARLAVRRMAAVMSGELERRVTISEALILAEEIVRERLGLVRND